MHLLSMMLVCAFLGQSSSAAVRDARGVVQYLKKQGVEVEYTAPLKQFWLEPVNGKARARKPLRVWFHGDWKARAEDLAILPKIPDLYGVTFGSQGIIEDWLKVLDKTPQLREVIITGPNFTDASTHYLEQLKDLDSLSLTLTRVTDKGLANIRALKKLEFLSLIGNEGITDTGFRGLHVKNLRFLNLEGTRVTEAGIASLEQSSKMEWLRLSGGTGKAGLQHLKGMKYLRRLGIGGMEASEREMKAVLDQAKSLEMIETSMGNFTRKGWQQD